MPETLESITKFNDIAQQVVFCTGAGVLGWLIGYFDIDIYLFFKHLKSRVVNKFHK
jgi:hypothetical protein